jgi:WD40 repeat protein
MTRGLALLLGFCLVHGLTGAAAAGGPKAKQGSKSATTGSLKLSPADRILTRHLGGACGLTFSADGKIVVSAGLRGDLRLLHVESGKVIRELPGHRAIVRCVRFSPDGTLLASAGQEPEILLWDVATGKLLRRIGKHVGGLYWFTFSADGKTLASGGFDERVGLWDVATGREIRSWSAHTRVAYAVAFSPDGKILATGGDRQGTIRFWDVATGKERGSWEAHGQCVYALTYSPDGKLLASGGGDDTACLWEVATGKLLRRLPGHTGGVVRVQFPADGRTLLTASYQRTIHLWETRTGLEIRRFGDHSGFVWGLAYSPMGWSVSSAGSDCAVVLWDLHTLAPRDGKAVGPDELERWWRDLAGSDAGKALAAVEGLCTAGAAQVLPFLEKRLAPATPPQVDPQSLARLIQDLDSPRYAAREKATRTLKQLGRAAGPALRQALSHPPSLEARRRLEPLVDILDRQQLSPDQMRSVRVVKVLEDSPAPAARKLLEKLAAGFAEDPLTQEAVTALRRRTQAGRAPR